MKLFKYVNQAGGIFAALLFIVMVGMVRHGIVGTPYYIVGGCFLTFAVMFLITASLLIFRSFIWHVLSNTLGTMLRHYVYAYIACYVLLIIVDHITMGSISWAHNFLYALIAAMTEVYINGYRLGFDIKKSVPENEQEDA